MTRPRGRPLRPPTGHNHLLLQVHTMLIQEFSPVPAGRGFYCVGPYVYICFMHYSDVERIQCVLQNMATAKEFSFFSSSMPFLLYRR